MRRFLGPLLTIILVLGVGAAIYLSVSQQFTARQVITVRGVIGSEKEEFFLDERVVAELRQHGLVVEIEKAGSRQIATDVDVSQYDFVFPAGVPGAEKIRREHGISRSFDVFFTPMAIASWRDIAEVLETNEIVREEEGFYMVVDVAKLLDAIDSGTRWNQLEGNTVYSVNKRILIN